MINSAVVKPREINPHSRENVEPRLALYRRLLGTAGLTYLLWWGSVELFLPAAFNPLGSRALVVAYCWALLAGTYLSAAMRRSGSQLLLSATLAITLHYFYLFHRNVPDINWLVGAYITAIACGACLQSERAYLQYAVATLVLSIVLACVHRAEVAEVFLPGMGTILIFGYVGLRSRLRLLRRSQEVTRWIQTLFDAVFEGIVVHEDGIITDVNEVFPAILGYTRDEVMGAPVTNFVAPEYRQAMRAQLELASDTPYEMMGERKDHSRVFLEIRGRTQVLRGRTLRLAAIRDVSARKTSELNQVLYESSQAAVRMRDEFLSIASHELKTPLTNIKLQSQMALRGLKRGDRSVLEPARVEKFIEQTDRQADRLARLVEEMLDVSRIATRSIAIERESFDLVPLLRDVAANFSGTLAKSGSTLELALPTQANLSADRFRLEQVISNLLANSIKYGEGKPIHVRLQRVGGEWRLEFEDQGIGIAPENHQRIFNRFERGIASTKIAGLGLGLYISKYIVEALDGRIEVTSALRSGSCFTVVLPAGDG